MNILLLRAVSPEDKINGGNHRLWNLLGQGNADVFCFQRESNVNSESNCKYRLIWRNITTINLIIDNLGISHHHFFPQLFLLKNQKQTKLLRSFVEEYLAKYPETTVVASCYITGLMAATFLQKKLIFDSTDSMSLYFKRRSQKLDSKELIKKINSIYMSNLYKNIEKYMAHYSALYVVTAEADRQHILRGYPKGNVTAIGIGTNWLDLPPIETQSNKVEATIAFHGGMNWEPNRVAALYLIKEIFPLVKAALPQAKLKIAGAPLFDELVDCSQCNGVEICGFVDDIRDWLSKCNVYAMPMLSGSGAKTKLIETMAAGLPIVTNSLGAEALPLPAKESILIADGKYEIAQAIISLIQDKNQRTKYAKKARYAAENHFHWQVLSAKLMQSIQATHSSIQDK